MQGWARFVEELWQLDETLRTQSKHSNDPEFRDKQTWMRE